MEWPCRGQFSHPHENEQDLNSFQLNSVAKVVFGVATVTFEVCPHSGISEAEIILDGLDLEGTK